jgi:GH24 family phage-related lysozyme (muramidase)
VSARAVNLFLSRIVQEEGNKLKPYDDATGLAVVAPVGNLSWGWGFNIIACGSVGLFRAMATYLVTELDSHLSQQAWYAALGSEPTRQSVFLDVAYNAGEDLVHHWPRMVAAAELRHWTECAAQCKVARPDLDKSRYAPLRALILSGDTAL